MSHETDSEKLQRVRLMADAGDAWDLSDNDISALQYVLDLVDGRKTCPKHLGVEPVPTISSTQGPIRSSSSSREGEK